MSSIILNDVSDFKNLVKAGATTVCERMGIKKSVKPQQEPFCEKRIDSDIARLRKDLSRLDKYRINAKCFTVITEEMKQRISPKYEKMRRYCARGNQYRQNKLFRCNQKAFYQKLGGKERYT